MTVDNPFEALAALDPELHATLEAARREAGLILPPNVAADIVATIIEGYQQEIHFGQSLAEGYRRLLRGGPLSALAVFGQEIRAAADRSASLGRCMADILPPVLLTRDDNLLAAFRKTLAILLTKGDYLVKAPLDGLTALLPNKDDAGRAYLELLQTVFDRPLSYNRCQYLGNLLPRAVRQLSRRRRSAQLHQMTRLVRVDLDLAEPFLEGLTQGLALLTAEALHLFVDEGLTLALEDPRAAKRFLALGSARGRRACQALQTTVTLSQEQARLNRYLQARTGQAGRVQAQAEIPGQDIPNEINTIRSGTDGVHLYLPEVVDAFTTRADNAKLLNVMAKFEAGLIEFDTFAFDLERARDLGCLDGLQLPASVWDDSKTPDLIVFSQCFDDPLLALDLLTLFEHGRVRTRMTDTYPGLIRDGLPLYQTAMQSQLETDRYGNLLDVLYATIALDFPDDLGAERCPQQARLVRDICARFHARALPTMRVEHCAGLVAATYAPVRQSLSATSAGGARLAPAYRRPLQTERIDAGSRDAHRQAHHLVQRLRSCGLKLYRGDLRRLLQQTAGRPSAEEIVRLACGPAYAGDAKTGGSVDLQPSPIPSDVLAEAALTDDMEDPDDVDRITWQREWNAQIGDYLHDHVRVRDRHPGGTDTGFYGTVLKRREGLVRQIRNAFELLRPEGLGILRQWIEGDDFDYRALLDVALDRRAGLLPSDRLYIKRVKQRRDVAVMLLVDLSRSTSNIVGGSQESVLDVAKEAIVLFTQALEIVGDAYAVAGFSGTGRLGVDYFRIKDFDEPLGGNVKGTLSALTPQRSTRMGAAVRRATLELMGRENRVRLLLMIGDGFPNDVGYKGDYAVQDTRQAIAEARSSGIVTQAITVNLPASPRLDDLYGPVRHTVISDVSELPDKLLRIYGALTRA